MPANLVVLGALDTLEAAAVDQFDSTGEIVLAFPSYHRNEYCPASVAFDTVKQAVDQKPRMVSIIGLQLEDYIPK